MKKILLCTLFTLSFSLFYAQEYKVAQSSGKIILKDVNGVKITGYTGSEVVFTGDEKEKEDIERSKGLKLINSKGLDDNTGLGISVQKEGGNLVVEKVGNNCKCEIEIKLPAGMGIEYHHDNYNGKEVTIEGVKGELDISAMYNDVILKNVTGPMAVKSVYGSISAEFSTVAQTGSISFNSIYDFVDITFPSTAKFNIKMSTPYGNIYSDVDIAVKTTAKGMRVISGSELEGTVNGGGVAVSIKSGYENIYLRKK